MMESVNYLKVPLERSVEVPACVEPVGKLLPALYPVEQQCRDFDQPTSVVGIHLLTDCIHGGNRR